MEKIPTLFARDPEDRSRLLLDRVTPGCEWVLAGEGEATRKYDGTCVMFDGQWWARRDVKEGGEVPTGYVEVGFDKATGKTVGWEPVEKSTHAKSHRKALEDAGDVSWEHGTYELCGPKVNRNPEGYSEHRLIRHDTAERAPDILWPPPPIVTDVPQWLHAIVLDMAVKGWEGIVWHHPDGRRAKLKARDFRQRGH